MNDDFMLPRRDHLFRIGPVCYVQGAGGIPDEHAGKTLNSVADDVPRARLSVHVVIYTHETGKRGCRLNVPGIPQVTVHFHSSLGSCTRC